MVGTIGIRKKPRKYIVGVWIELYVGKERTSVVLFSVFLIAGFPVQGSRVQNHAVVPRST